MSQYDVVIVGGAVIGSAVAYFLSHEPGFDGRIAVVERDPGYTESATGRSAGGLRQQFSTPENIAMSLFGLDFVRSVKDRFGAEADVGFQERGYMLLASDDGAPVLEANVALQREHGADIALLSPRDLADRFPWLSREGIAAAALGESGEGWLDPFSLMSLLRKAAQARGVDYVTGEVTGIAVDGTRVTGVRLADGAEIACGALVNAAGPAAGRVAALAGVALPVEPRKRYVFVFDCRATLPEYTPLVVAPSGVYFRREGAQYVTGLSPDAAAEPTPDDLEVDYGWFEDEIWPRLAERVPAFEAIKMTGAWAGHYDYNTVDQNAIIGAHPQIANLYFANGFSGHGLQQAPAVGRAIAELIVHGRYVALDLRRFGVDRVVTGAAVRELNVV